jgi:hypothetical protein
MTPEFSRQLEQAAHAPLWQRDLDTIKARDRFVEQATQYDTLEAMPARLREVYRRAMASIKHEQE